jgi:hypothetical protein
MARARELELEAISILEHEPPGPDLVWVYGHAALRAAISGQNDDAASLIEKGFALAAELGVEDVMTLLMARATVRGTNGDPACLADNREARDVGLRLGLGRMTSVAINNLADATYGYESVPAARGVWDEAIAFSRARGLTLMEMWQRGERLRALYHMGSWDELEREAGEVASWIAEHGGGQLEIFPRVWLAETLVHRAALADAEAHVAAFLPRARESGDPQVLVPGLAAAALVASARQENRLALDYVSELEERTRGRGVWRSLCLAWPARIAVAAGEPALAQAFLEGSENATAWDAAARPGARAVLAAAQGNADEAAVLYAEAAERWATYGSVVEQAYALLGLGRCDDVDALRGGEAIFERLGAAPVFARAA